MQNINNPPIIVVVQLLLLQSSQRLEWKRDYWELGSCVDWNQNIETLDDLRSKQKCGNVNTRLYEVFSTE
jgi:hypothetical protein